MHIHILGICGTFMGGIALIARSLGYRVTGSDANVYPPMSTLLAEQGIEIMPGYDPEHLRPVPDIVVIGNAMSRGNPVVEYVLEKNLPYVSGPQWLYEQVLQQRWVLAVAGTHGKTTTTSILSWLLEDNGLQPGFLIGGVANNFGISARLGDSDFFVIEADEYDTAFFDKRSKFVHYHPRSLVINNLEYDHADIFRDLDAIKTQFHHLLRTVPGNGLIIFPEFDQNVQSVLAQGCWSETEQFSEFEDAAWQCVPERPDYSQFAVLYQGETLGSVHWQLIGQHNMFNALAAIIAARHVGIAPQHAIDSLRRFRGIKRRMEIRGVVNGITVYDDFAHHPTAIATTLDGLRRQVGDARIVAVLELRSNTMRQGVHAAELANSLSGADVVFALQPQNVDWRLQDVLQQLDAVTVQSSVASLVDSISNMAKPGDHVLIMSNGGFDDIHQQLLETLDH